MTATRNAQSAQQPKAAFVLKMKMLGLFLYP